MTQKDAINELTRGGFSAQALLRAGAQIGDLQDAGYTDDLHALSQHEARIARMRTADSKMRPLASLLLRHHRPMPS